MLIVIKYNYEKSDISVDACPIGLHRLQKDDMLPGGGMPNEYADPGYHYGEKQPGKDLFKKNT